MLGLSVYFIGSFVISKLLMPMFLHLLYDANSVRSNYRGENIPVSIGIVFIPVMVINVIYLVFINGSKHESLEAFVFFAGVVSMGLAGLLDDLLGNRDVSGLKGHFKKMFKGELTTGGFKAAFGGMIAFAISLFVGGGIGNIVMNTLIIALCTNFINLLDLRPGRAIKGFLVTSFIFIINPIYSTFRALLLGLIGATLSYLPYDLKAKSMMGDVGSNILGISLGMVCVSSSFNVRIGMFIFLIGIHIYTEKYSLTKTIEKVKLLKYLDEMGRS